jgi:ribosomal protein S18 acetylase RimI-like enzyme
MPVRVTPLVDFSPSDIQSLIAESEKEGWRFVRQLASDFVSGANRFDGPGETLFAARDDDGSIVGICGLNADPYAAEQSVGRVRRLYVMAAHRRRGIGRLLVEAVVAAASGTFRSLRVRTNNPQAARLYERMGFQAVTDVANCTHRLEFDGA